MKSDISNMLSRFFKKYKNQLDPDDLNKFGELWKSFYEVVQEDDIWRKGGKHYKNFHTSDAPILKIIELNLHYLACLQIG